ncbi:MAG TPA: amidophosphoribosyltransferase [Nannocystaceae bacterium]|nr:amidophosphoribosyltransferase [Nannocystaceae bacterium]
MCGFVGIIATGTVAPAIHIALQALQHRGQDCAGIATMRADGEEFFAHRGLGQVPQAVPIDVLATLEGPVGLGHVRYPTIGRGLLRDAQPFFFRQPGVLMAHNGNVTNYRALRQSLLQRSIHLLSQCDVEPVMCEFADALNLARRSQHTIADAMNALGEVRRRVKGSYSIVAALMLDGLPTLVVFRDPNGIRPAVLGRKGTGDETAWVCASETVALDALGFERVEEPSPGEVLFLRAGAEPIRRSIESEVRAPCVFEHIYFARPDSTIDERVVYNSRMELGRALAERIAKKGIAADVVVPVPDTARPAAAALAETIGLPLREGFIKNRYSGRTFIMPDALTRNSALRLKLNPLRSEIAGRRVLLVDDSIVRGTTLGRVIALLRDAGATEVHLAIHAPPVRHPCFYGIDMSTEEELFARRFDSDLDVLEREAASTLEVESLTYLPVEAMNRVMPGPRCAACFDGRYPQHVDAAAREGIVDDRRARDHA